MSAFLIAHVTIKNPDRFKEYGASASGTFAPFGGELVLKGKMSNVLEGNHSHQMAAIIKFPDMKSLNNWYKSDAYQAIIPIRDEGADVTFVTYEEPSAAA